MSVMLLEIINYQDGECWDPNNMFNTPALLCISHRGPEFPKPDITVLFCPMLFQVKCGSDLWILELSTTV